MNDLVSVVVPIYNVEKYLDRCVQSIVEQTYSNLEIILVDDGSTDGSPAMCDAWKTKDPRIQVVHKTNAGLGMARNTGIECATGKYIFFFDSDDYIDLTLVEKCVLDAQKHGSQVVVFGRSEVYDDGKIVEKKVDDRRLVFQNESVPDELLPRLFTYELGFGVSAWGKMYRLDVLRQQKLSFRSEREIISEDAYFMLELLTRVETVSVVPECLYFYCKRSGSLSRVYRKDRQKRNDDFLAQCTAYAQSHQLNDKTVQHIQSRYHGLTLGTLMQIMRSDLTKKEKRAERRKLYHNNVLRDTLTPEVVALDGKFPKLFWRCMRSKSYWLCTLLLYVNMYK